MPSDLRVLAVRLPSPPRADCQLIAVVTVVNDGSDAADGPDFDVTIQVRAVAEQPILSTFSAIVNTPEEARLAPGRRIDVSVSVRLPCGMPSVFLSTQADTMNRVPNNAHSAPPLT